MVYIKPSCVGVLVTALLVSEGFAAPQDFEQGLKPMDGEHHHHHMEGQRPGAAAPTGYQPNLVKRQFPGVAQPTDGLRHHHHMENPPFPIRPIEARDSGKRQHEWRQPGAAQPSDASFPHHHHHHPEQDASSHQDGASQQMKRIVEDPERHWPEGAPRPSGVNWPHFPPMEEKIGQAKRDFEEGHHHWPEGAARPTGVPHHPIPEEKFAQGKRDFEEGHRHWPEGAPRPTGFPHHPIPDEKITQAKRDVEEGHRHWPEGAARPTGIPHRPFPMEEKMAQEKRAFDPGHSFWPEGVFPRTKTSYEVPPLASFYAEGKRDVEQGHHFWPEGAARPTGIPHHHFPQGDGEEKTDKRQLTHADPKIFPPGTGPGPVVEARADEMLANHHIYQPGEYGLDKRQLEQPEPNVFRPGFGHGPVVINRPHSTDTAASKRQLQEPEPSIFKPGFGVGPVVIHHDSAGSAATPSARPVQKRGMPLEVDGAPSPGGEAQKSNYNRPASSAPQADGPRGGFASAGNQVSEGSVAQDKGNMASQGGQQGPGAPAALPVKRSPERGQVGYRPAFQHTTTELAHPTPVRGRRGMAGRRQVPGVFSNMFNGAAMPTGGAGSGSGMRGDLSNLLGTGAVGAGVALPTGGAVPGDLGMGGDSSSRGDSGIFSENFPGSHGHHKEHEHEHHHEHLFPTGDAESFQSEAMPTVLPRGYKKGPLRSSWKIY